MLPLAHAEVSFEPLQLAPVAIIALLYWGRARTLARQRRPVSAWRKASFAGGIALIVVALSSPLAAYDDELIWVHMAQHLVLGDLASLLIVLGLTGPLLQPLLAAPGLGWLRVLVHPAVALPLWLVDFYLWHIPALYQATLSSEVVHALEHACFVGFGIAMWMALLGPLPKPSWFGNGARLIYVLVVRFGGAVLANVMIWYGSALYPDYAPGEAEHGISALADQGVAGTVMMIEQGFVTLGLFAWLFFRWAKESEERQSLLDLAAERGVVLDEARAARAVAAGQGARLRERIEASAEQQAASGT
jgi:cytochrome c oxidase assembly factor CtaG